MLKGIDVSDHQGVFPWAAVKPNIAFAIIRASHGMNEVDDQFARNYAECKRLGIPVGAYHYFYYGDPAKHRAEQMNFLSQIKGKTFELGVWIDYEERNPNNPMDLSDPSKFVTTQFALDDLKFLEANGFRAGIYTYNAYAYAEMDMSKIPSKNPVWIARYHDHCDYTGRWDMWQYTSDGVVAGYAGRLDCNQIPDNKIALVFPGYSAFKPYKVNVTASVLNIRRLPSANSTDMGDLLKGAVVTILEVKGNWGRIDRGWICLDFTVRA